MNGLTSQTEQEPKTKMRMVSYSTSRTRQDIIKMVDSKHFVIWDLCCCVQQRQYMHNQYISFRKEQQQSYRAGLYN
jgi:hypothetical protein